MTPAEQAAWDKKYPPTPQPAVVETPPPVEAKPEPAEPPPAPKPKPKPDPLKDEAIQFLKDQVTDLDQYLGQGPQNDPESGRMYRLRDAAREIVRVHELPHRTPEDVASGKKALEDYKKVQTEELAEATKPSYVQPLVRLQTQISNLEDLQQDAQKGPASPGDIHRLDDATVPLQLKMNELQAHPGMGELRTEDEPKVQTQEDIGALEKKIREEKTPFDSDLYGSGHTEINQDTAALNKLKEKAANEEAATEPHYTEVKPPTVQAILEGPTDTIQDPDLKARVEQIRNDYYSDPFTDEDQKQSLLSQRIDPFELSNGFKTGNPSQTIGELTDVLTTGYLHHDGYSNEKPAPQDIYDSTHLRAKRDAENMVLAVYGRMGDHNLQVLRNVDEEIRRTQAPDLLTSALAGIAMTPGTSEFSAGGAPSTVYPEASLLSTQFLAPFRMMMTPGTYVTGMNEEAKGDKIEPVLHGVPIYNRGGSFWNTFRISPTTAVASWLFNEAATPTIGGETGWGGKRHLEAEAYGADPLQYTGELYRFNKAFAGTATQKDLEPYHSPALLLAKRFAPEKYEAMGSPPGMAELLTGAELGAYILFDPNIWNVATLGAGKLAHLGGLEAAANAAAREGATNAGKLVERIDEAIPNLANATDGEVNAFRASLGAAPGTPEGLITQAVENRLRTREVQEALGLDDISAEHFAPEASGVRNESRYRAEPTALEGPHPELNATIGPPALPLEQGAERIGTMIQHEADAATQAAKDFTKEFGVAPKQAASREQITENALIRRVRAAIGQDPAGKQALKTLIAMTGRRDSLAQRLAKIALISRSRMGGALMGVGHAESPQNVIRALYENDSRLQRIAADAVKAMRKASGTVDWATGHMTGGKKLAWEAYQALIRKLSYNQIQNLGDLQVARLVAEIDNADNAIDRAATVTSTRLTRLGQPGLSRDMLNFRKTHAAVADAQARLARLTEAHQQLTPLRILEMYRDEAAALRDSLLARSKGAPVQAPHLKPDWEGFVQNGQMDVPAYLDFLGLKYGKDAVRTAVDAPIGEVAQRLDANPTVGLDEQRQLRGFEEAVAAEGFKRRFEVPVAAGNQYLSTLESSKVKPTLTTLWFKTLKTMARRLDRVGSGEAGNLPQIARDLEHQNGERIHAQLRDTYDIMSGRIKSDNPTKHEGIDAALDFLTNPDRPVYRDYLGLPLPWNQDIISPSEKAYRYLRSLAFADKLGGQLTTEILTHLPLPSGRNVTEAITAEATGALKHLLIRSETPGDFWEKVVPTVNRAYLKELGSTEAHEVVKHFLANAINFGSAQYDSWMDMQRVFGPGIDTNTANTLNYFQTPGASTLGVGSPDLAAATAAQWGLPAMSNMEGKANIWRKLTGGLLGTVEATDARMVQQGIDRGYGIWMPEAYRKAVENNSAFSHLAKEMAEFHRSAPATQQALIRWWAAYRMARIYGVINPRLPLWTNNRMGSFSEVILEPGGLGRATTALATTLPVSVPRINVKGEPLTIPMVGLSKNLHPEIQRWRISGFALQQHLATLADRYNSTIGWLFDNDLYRFLRGQPGDTLTLPSGEKVLWDDELKWVMESGAKSTLANPELEEIRKARALRSQTAAAAPGQPAPALPAPSPSAMARARAILSRISTAYNDTTKHLAFIENFARWIEQIDSNERMAYLMRLRLGEGVPRQEAEQRMLSRFLDFNQGVGDGEYFGRLFMVYRYQRLFFRQLGENIALSMTAANTQPWWRTVTGQTPIGRAVRTAQAARGARDILDWRDPDETVDDQAQLHAFMRRQTRWWERAGVYFELPDPNDAYKKAEKKLSGRDVNNLELLLPALQSLDQMYMLNSFIQTVLATTVGGANAAGVDTNRVAIGAPAIAEQWTTEFADHLDPTLGALFKSLTEQTSPKGVLVPRNKAILYKHIAQLAGMPTSGALWWHEDPDGQVRIDNNYKMILDYIAGPVMDDIARGISAWDTPEMLNGQNGPALARAIAAMTGLFTVSGFDPAAEWDYETGDRAADLRELEDAARRNVKTKEELRRGHPH